MEKVKQVIYNEIDFTKINTIVLAISGGPDSMALLNILKNITPKLKIICAHVDHNVRKNSIKDRMFVKKYCEENKIIYEEFIIKKYEKDNFHMDARIQRYNFFEKIIRKYDAKYLFTAHHGDDLLETILMRFTRGTTVRGMGGIRLVSVRNSYKIIRPMLGVSKEDILNYCHQENIKYRIDETNISDKYTRNRFRKNIIPLLKEENNNIINNALNFSCEIFELDQYIENQVSDIYKEVVYHEVIDIEKLKKKDLLIQKRIILRWLQTEYLEHIKNLNKKHVDAVFNLLYSTKTTATLFLPNNKEAIKSYGKLYLHKHKVIQQYKIEIIDNINLPNGKNIMAEKTVDLTDNSVTYLNTKKLNLPLYAIGYSGNLKMDVKNSLFSKKISRIFIDEKIDKNNRVGYPIVVDKTGEVVWLPGIKKSKFDVGKKGEYDIILRYY